MPRINGSPPDLLRAALLTFISSLIFWGFFQISKSPNFAAVNPFADDPADAIGAIAVQVAFAVSLLTLARAVRVNHRPVSTYKGRLIVRGNSVALLTIAITLVADLNAELPRPTWNESIWGMGLIVGLGAVALITCAAILITITAARRLKTGQSSAPMDEAGSLAEALDDLWALIRTILAWFSRPLPWLNRPLRWIENLGNQLFNWLMNWPSIGPRIYPWRFCAAVALTAGVALAVTHALEEGPPGNLALAVRVSSIFIGVEFVAVLIGYLVFGGFLGLRLPLRLHRR